MERRIGLRARTDFAITADNGFSELALRAVELSGSGVVIDRGRELLPDEVPMLLRLELKLPERCRTIQTLARPVRIQGRYQALRFISLNDADRLTLAEHVDLQQRRGSVLH